MAQLNTISKEPTAGYYFRNPSKSDNGQYLWNRTAQDAAQERFYGALRRGGALLLVTQ